MADQEGGIKQSLLNDPKSTVDFEDYRISVWEWIISMGVLLGGFVGFILNFALESNRVDDVNDMRAAEQAIWYSIMVMMSLSIFIYLLLTAVYYSESTICYQFTLACFVAFSFCLPKPAKYGGNKKKYRKDSYYKSMIVRRMMCMLVIDIAEITLSVVVQNRNVGLVYLAYCGFEACLYGLDVYTISGGFVCGDRFKFLKAAYKIKK